MTQLIGIPFPCACGNHGAQARVPLGGTHARGEPCPLVSDTERRESGEGTCSCRVDMGIVRDALHRLGEHRFAVEVTAPMTAEEALATGSDLERVGETLRERAVSEGRADVGQTFIEDCDTVAAASEWYREVGEMGFGIQFIRITTITGGIPSEPRAA